MSPRMVSVPSKIATWSPHEAIKGTAVLSLCLEILAHSDTQAGIFKSAFFKVWCIFLDILH